MNRISSPRNEGVISRRGIITAVTLVASVGAALPAVAGYRAVRQYYSGWHRPANRSYCYRIHHYQPRAAVPTYRQHYVIWHPRRPRHYYFYNPVRRVYWGRCPLEQSGPGVYSLLAERDRSGDLESIPESAFPAPGPLPSVPGAEDLQLELPPDEPPPADLVR